MFAVGVTTWWWCRTGCCTDLPDTGDKMYVIVNWLHGSKAVLYGTIIWSHQRILLHSNLHNCGEELASGVNWNDDERLSSTGDKTYSDNELSSVVNWIDAGEGLSSTADQHDSGAEWSSVVSWRGGWNPSSTAILHGQDSSDTVQWLDGTEELSCVVNWHGGYKALPTAVDWQVNREG